VGLNAANMTDIEALQEQIKSIVQSLHVDYAAQLRDLAKVDALTSIILDLAKREGLSAQRFQMVLEQRSQHFHQRRLEGIENVSGSLAAKIETILPSKEDPGAELLPLFPD
jgi:hypothetical protein